MIQTIKTTFKLETSMSVNAFLFYFKRIPLIGNLFSDKIYQQVSLKSAIAVLVFILKTVRELVFKSTYVGLAMFLPIFFLYKSSPFTMQFEAFTHSFFIFCCVISPLLFNETFDSSRPKVIAIKILHIPANRYYIVHIFYSAIRNTVLFCPSICIFTLLAKGSILQGLFFTLLLSLIRIIGEAFHLLLFSKTKQIIRKHVVLHVFLLALLLSANYGPIIAHITLPTKMIIFSLPFILTILLLSIGSISYILRFSHYSKVFHASDNVKDIAADRKKAVREATFRDVNLKDADLTSSLLHNEAYKDKCGYAYLNALFFERHRRMLLNPMYIILACIGLCFIAALAAFYFIPDSSSLYIQVLSKGFPSLVFIMYVLSISLCQRATKAMFYNCDISLLRYSYYRKKAVILTNFRIRLRKILVINGLPAIAIAAGLLALGFFAAPNEIISIIPIIILVLILSVFFSVHHLFMYYVFQPYTTDLDVKNPIYKVVNGIVYLASYVCLQIHQAPSAFLILILAVTIIYTMIALALILRLAPKTFRVK